MSAPITLETGLQADDQVLPFRIDGQDVRGRAVRLGPAAHEILSKHEYAAPVDRLVGELAALTALLGSVMKFGDGILTVQIKGKGPVPMMVADFHSGGRIRAYAEVDETKLNALGRHPSFHALTGAGGYLALTLDQGPETERYQGIVELHGQTLGDCAVEYFTTSEQIPTRLRLAAGRDREGSWRAGGIMVQYLPHGDEEEGAPRAATFGDRDLEPFHRAAMLMETVRDDELLGLPLPDLLFRLFHEDGVRVFHPQPVAFGCRCDRDRIGAVLARYPREQLMEMAEDDGLITVTCQFCASHYRFEP
ncbi:MAG: Hsp33 family molecular chaperone HslO [Rhodothalassiaceae bacterium]